MSRIPQGYVHPDLRPAAAEQPSAPRLTYRDVLARICDAVPATGFCRVKDLPELSLEELAAVVRHYPAAFIEAMADYDLELRDLTAETLGGNIRFIDRYRLIGVHIVGALRLYVLPLVLRDVQMQCENNRIADAIERDSHSRDDGLVAGALQ